jgi:hypothetical protein
MHRDRVDRPRCSEHRLASSAKHRDRNGSADGDAGRKARARDTGHFARLGIDSVSAAKI